MGKHNLVYPEKWVQDEVLGQYTNVKQAIIRELLQNSRDANAKVIDLHFSEGEYTCADNGTGMSLEEYLDRFLTLGGTYKEEGATGGKGKAKKLIALAWETHIAHGLDFTAHGSYAGEVESTSAKGKGFTIGASDSFFVETDMVNALFDVLELSDYRVKVKVSSDTGLDNFVVKSGRKLRQNQAVKDFGWGTLYVHKSGAKGSEEIGRLYIRTNGLYTASDYVGGPYIFYLDITGNSAEILTESRDALHYQYKNEVQYVVSGIVDKPQQLESNPDLSTMTIYGLETFLSSKTTKEDSPAIDMSTLMATVRASVANSEVVHLDKGTSHQARYSGSPELSIDDLLEFESYIQDGNVVIEEATVESVDIDNRPQETVILEDTVHTQELGQMKVEQEDSMIWNKPAFISGKGKGVLRQGKVTKKYDKALSIWSSLINQLSDILEIDRMLPGLLFESDHQAVHVTWREGLEGIAVQPDAVLKLSPYGLLDLAIHEIVHHFIGGHSQDYEYKRSNIAEDLGEVALGLLDSIRRMQAV